MTQARVRTIRYAFVTLDIRKVLIQSSNQLWTPCHHAVEYGELRRKVALMGVSNGG